MTETVEKLFDTAWQWLSDFLPNLFGAIIIAVIGMWLSGVLSGFICKAMRKTHISETVISFIHSFSNIALKVLTVVIVLGTLGFNVSSIVATIGVAAAAVALALQDSLKNIAGGIMVIINEPFHVGDFVEISELQGTVTKIDISSTHMLTVDNKEIIIPNSNVTSANITNFSSQENRRVDLTFCVSYDSQINEVRAVLNNVIDKCDKVLDNPERLIAVGEHEDSSVQIIVRIWCKREDYWDVYFYMQENVKLAFDENGIVIPFTQVDVHSGCVPTNKQI